MGSTKKQQNTTVPVTGTNQQILGPHRHYTITYSPNFNRHLVSIQNENGKKTAVRSFLWLDEALQAYPNATLVPMDLPPPSFPSTTATTTNNSKKQVQTLLLSRLVAGAGVNEGKVYYNDTTSEVIKPGSPAMKNNGGTYLYRFLLKLYSTLTDGSPAEIHRGVMDKFPRIAFYDAALVHERLFFLLSPLPPKDVLDNLRKATQVKPIKRSKLLADANNNTNAAAEFFDDFPLLFYKYGYGAGLSKFQLAQALQSLPQYWLPMYLGDALASARKPQDVLPYIWNNLISTSPNAFRDATEELDHLLTGTAWADIASLAHAKSTLKLSSDQCRILLKAFPTLRTSDTEPNWEFLQRGRVRPILIEYSLAYLRIRLQLDPVQIFAMIKTHTRLSTYTVNCIKPILDALQNKIGLESKELQQLILRMPSLLGMSVSSLDARIYFFLNEVGMTRTQLKKSVLQLPAFLQYGLPNLKTKLEFFRNHLHIEDRSLIVNNILAAQPTLWGLSVEQNLKPTAASLGDYCGLSSHEVRKVILNAPELLLFNWKGNLEPKLRFLVDRLDLSPDELKSLVLSSPRILTYSINGALNAKIDMLEEHLSQNPKEVLLQMPSLLLTSKSRLYMRLSRPGALNKLTELAKDEGAVKGRNRRVLELSRDGVTVLREFSSVREASTAVGTSVPNMYRVVALGKVLRDRIYSYEEKSNIQGIEDQSVESESVESDDTKSFTLHPNADETCLTVYVSGRVYPPSDASLARGARRVGGLVVAMPSLSRNFGTLLEQVLKDLYETQLLGLKSCQLDDDRDGLVALIGYTNFKPSRRRCSLFACFVSLRVVTQLFVLIGKASKGVVPAHIDIITDSGYVFELLHDTERLREWGSALTPQEFVYAGNYPKWYANTDILYALSRAYYKLVDPQGAISSALQANVTLRFRMDSGSTGPIVVARFCEKMDSWGQEAAKLYYQRSQEPTVQDFA